MFYCDLSGQVLAGDRQLWSSCGSVLLDQIEVNKGHLLPVQNNLLMVGCKQLKMLLQLTRYSEWESKLPWLQSDVQGFMYFSG